MTTFSHRFNQYRVYEDNKCNQLLCVIDPFKKNEPDAATLNDFDMTKAAWFDQILGFVPAILAHRDNENWYESACMAHKYAGGFGAPIDAKLSGFVLKGDKYDEYEEPDLYPIAVFERPDTGERAIFYPYAITCFTNNKGELIGATRLD